MKPETKNLILGVVLLIVGTFIGYGLRTNSEPYVGKGYGDRDRMMSKGSMVGGSVDRRFIEEMIPHHEGAIAMAKVALERSKRPEIISLSNGIIEAQEKENGEMRSWYQSWFGSAPSKGSQSGMMHMQGMEGDIDALKATSSADFDREFIEQMIPHHEMAIMMARMLAAGTQRREMKQLADNIITSQSREIGMMNDWLKSWYPVQ